MAQPVLTLRGKDVSAYVRSWGSLQAIRKLKLSDSSLFASVFSIELDNTKGAFTPGGSASMLPRMGWAGLPVTVSKDGKDRFNGFLRDLTVDDSAQSVTLEMTTSMTEAAEAIADLSEAGLNPAAACLALLEQAGLDDSKLDRSSFSVAAGFFGDHTIAVECPASEGQTALSLASKIADVCSMDFVVVRGRIYCLPQRPWKGGGLRQAITGDNTRDFESLRSDSASFANSVIFNYGAASLVTVQDEASIRAEGRTVSTTVDATDEALVQVDSQTSAYFFARLLLSRLSPRRYLLKAVLGPDFDEVQPGWKYPVNYDPLALSAAPFEVNEAAENLDADEVTVTLQSLHSSS